LEEAGELDTLRQAHTTYFGQRAIEQWQLLYSPEALALFRRIETDHDNYRAALASALEPGGDVLSAGWICIFLLWFWYRRGYMQEGRVWSERLMRATEAIGGIPHGMALNTAAMMAMWLGDLDVADERLIKALPLAEQANFTLGISMGHFSYGVNLINRGRDREAYAQLTQAAEMFDEADMRWEQVNTYVHLANAALGLGETRQAERWLREAMPMAERIGDPWQIALNLNNIGEVARARGDYEEARGYYERAEALYREADSLSDHARLIHTLGYMALHDADLARAEELFQESLAAFRKLGNKRGMAECLGGLATVAAMRDDSVWAAELLAAADAQLAAGGAAWWPADRVEVDRTRRRLREALGEAGFAAAWERGRTLGLEEAIRRVTDG
jgi:tetratricopeptide (TPR) repeat protein